LHLSVRFFPFSEGTPIKQQFDFKKGTCDLEILKGKKATVIVTEIADNPGTSVTNAFESIATQVYQQFLYEYSIHDITWIEHYNQDSYEPAGDDPETFDQVSLSWNPKTRKFHTPQWRPYTEWETFDHPNFSRAAGLIY